MSVSFKEDPIAIETVDEPPEGLLPRGPDVSSGVDPAHQGVKSVTTVTTEGWAESERGEKIHLKDIAKILRQDHEHQDQFSEVVGFDLCVSS